MGNVNSVDEEEKVIIGDDGKKADTVQYESYRRVLADHKKSKARAEELEAKLALIEKKEKELEEKSLKEQGEYKKLLEIEKKKREIEESKRIQYEKDLLDAHKLNAVKEKLPAKVKRNEYYSFIDTDKILIDKETGIIDEASLESVANDFITNHSALLDKPSVKNLPQDAAKGTATKLTLEDWKKLPLKEKKKRMVDVRD